MVKHKWQSNNRIKLFAMIQLTSTSLAATIAIVTILLRMLEDQVISFNQLVRIEITHCGTSWITTREEASLTNIGAVIANATAQTCSAEHMCAAVLQLGLRNTQNAEVHL